MFYRTTCVALAATFIPLAGPASATILTLPFIGDVEHPDLDPLHILNPEPAPAPAAMPVKKHHHHKKKM